MNDDAKKKDSSPSKKNREQNFDFDSLVGIFEQTHGELQKRAARSVDISLVIRNWLFGLYIVEFEQEGTLDRSEVYGKKLIENLSERLKEKNIRGMSATNLRKFREFYLAYQEIQQAVPVESSNLLFAFLHRRNLQPILNHLKERFQLGWTHYVELLRLKDPAARNFYELEAVENEWGYRELARQMNTSLFERLALSKNKETFKQLSQRGQEISSAADMIKNPYILEFTGLEQKSSYSELDLESALINKIESFLLELGKGFLFESRQRRFSFDNRHFYVDLVFYNRLLRCYVIIDLKIGDLKHQDLGQMQMYVNYFDRFVKTEDEKPTVGILLCHTKSDELVELTLPENANVYASEYQLYLPNKEELRKQLAQAQSEWKTQQGQSEQ